MYDYTTLTGAKSTAGSIRSWVNHADVPAEQILYDAQAEIFLTLRVLEMVETLAVSLAIGDDAYTVDDRFLDPIELRFDGYPNPLDYVQENFNRRIRDADGELLAGPPMQFIYADGQLQFDTKADQVLTGSLICYRRPQFIASDNATNFLSSKYPVLLRHMCTAFGYEARRRIDERDRELKLAYADITKANAASDTRRRTQLRW